MENENKEIKEDIEEPSSDEEIEKMEESKPKRKQTEKQKECFRIARENVWLILLKIMKQRIYKNKRKRLKLKQK
jgi:hypothetical protein